MPDNFTPDDILDVKDDSSQRGADDNENYYNKWVDALAKIGELEAELETEKEKGQFEKIRAGMMEPYAKKVFWFVVVYCLVILALLLLDSIRWINKFFQIETSILVVISGSTAVAVVGLIGLVVSGLFNAPKSESKDK